jgi:hypothetical protein
MVTARAEKAGGRRRPLIAAAVRMNNLITDADVLYQMSQIEDIDGE